MSKGAGSTLKAALGARPPRSPFDRLPAVRASQRAPRDDRLGLDNAGVLVRDPDLQSLRALPEFRELLKKIRSGD